MSKFLLPLPHNPDIINDTDDEVTTIYNTETSSPLSVNTDLN